MNTCSSRSSFGLSSSSHGDVSCVWRHLRHFGADTGSDDWRHRFHRLHRQKRWRLRFRVMGHWSVLVMQHVFVSVVLMMRCDGVHLRIRRLHGAQVEARMLLLLLHMLRMLQVRCLAFQVMLLLGVMRLRRMIVAVRMRHCGVLIHVGADCCNRSRIFKCGGRRIVHFLMSGRPVFPMMVLLFIHHLISFGKLVFP